MNIQRIVPLLTEAVQRGVFPGASLLVARGEDVLFEACVGNACVDSESWPVVGDTLFDLASVTKALGTSVVAMLAVAEGRAELTELLGRRLPLPRSLSAQPVWHLLAHASGLPAWAPLYEELDRARGAGHVSRDRESCRAWMRQRVAQTPLASSPGELSVYSDLGFMLLEWWLEEVFGERIDGIFSSRVTLPLGLGDTGYVDQDAPCRYPQERYAATERCGYRGRVICGEVHDQNTWAMGGISGQAGLFSTAPEMHRVLLALWRAWCGGAGPVPGEVVQRFWAPSGVPRSSFRLGWDGPSAEGYSAAGQRMPGEAVGHLGFTGCSVWLVPSDGLWVVLLSNRVHPTVDNTLIRTFRPFLHDLLLEELGYPLRGKAGQLHPGGARAERSVPAARAKGEVLRTVSTAGGREDPPPKDIEPDHGRHE